jgi:hypothetical protein
VFAVLTPLLIEDGLRWLLEGVLGWHVEQLTLIIALLGLGLYWRKFQSFAGLLSSAIGRVVTVAVAIAVLRALEVIPALDVGRALGLAAEIVSWALDLVPLLAEVA